MCALLFILHPRGWTELPEPCCESQSRNGDTDLGHWLWFPIYGAVLAAWEPVQRAGSVQ